MCFCHLYAVSQHLFCIYFLILRQNLSINYFSIHISNRPPGAHHLDQPNYFSNHLQKKCDRIQSFPIIFHQVHTTEIIRQEHVHHQLIRTIDQPITSQLTSSSTNPTLMRPVLLTLAVPHSSGQQMSPILNVDRWGI